MQDTDPELFDADHFSERLQTEANHIPLFKNTIKQGNELIKRRFLATSSAHDSVSQRAWLTDQLLIHAWQRFESLREGRLVLLAVGGYGRGELHPGSDVDILVLFEHEMSPATEEAVRDFLTFLWDIGMQVGHAVRSLEECKQEARSDITVITNLIEGRLLTGDQALFRTLQQALAPTQMWSSREFFEAKCQEQRERHRKYHDTAYNLEPNIKECPGGLRDVQTIGWVAKRHFNVTTLHDLVYRNFLTEEEYHTLQDAQEFLWRVRCHLHTIAKRKEDRLLFDYQRPLAEIFGFEDKAPDLGVELFMRKYYRTAKLIIMLNEMLVQLMQEAILNQRTDVIEPINKRFQICNDYIEAVHDRVFINYPFALLEIFLLIQQHPKIKGIRAGTVRLILQYKYLIDSSFHEDLRARSIFFEIIRQPRGQTRAFRLMTRYGVLPAYIPAFGNITGRMQYDLFHAYTVDQHTLFVIRNLRRFAVNEHRDEFPVCSEIISRLPKPELLYLAGLFHDIGKGRGGDHSELGRKDAVNFCLAHGLSYDDARFVGWLVKNHLIMSMTMQREDIHDPEVVHHFAQRMGDLEHMDYLYLLTVADIRGTNPTLWNRWKASLLSALYHNARHVLLEGLQFPVDKQHRVQDIQAQALALLGDCDEAKVRDLWQHIQDDYFLRSSPEDIARETRVILAHGMDTPQVMVRKEGHGGTAFLIYTQDKAHLFADTTYYLEQKALSVVSAYLNATETGAILLSYTVLEGDGRPIAEEESHLEDIRAGLEHAVARPTPQDTFVKRMPADKVHHFPVPTRVTFSRDTLRNHTVMEVVTTDRPGVLSRIAQALLQCKVRVISAKISTFGSRVEDIFFITDDDGIALKSPDQFDCLREKLTELLDQSVEMPRGMVI